MRILFVTFFTRADIANSILRFSPEKKGARRSPKPVSVSDLRMEVYFKVTLLSICARIKKREVETRFHLYLAINGIRIKLKISIFTYLWTNSFLHFPRMYSYTRTHIKDVDSILEYVSIFRLRARKECTETHFDSFRCTNKTTQIVALPLHFQSTGRRINLYYSFACSSTIKISSLKNIVKNAKCAL